MEFGINFKWFINWVWYIYSFLFFSFRFLWDSVYMNVNELIREVKIKKKDVYIMVIIFFLLNILLSECGNFLVIYEEV